MSCVLMFLAVNKVVLPLQQQMDTSQFGLSMLLQANFVNYS